MVTTYPLSSKAWQDILFIFTGINEDGPTSPSGILVVGFTWTALFTEQLCSSIAAASLLTFPLAFLRDWMSF